MASALLVCGTPVIGQLIPELYMFLVNPEICRVLASTRELANLAPLEGDRRFWVFPADVEIDNAIQRRMTDNWPRWKHFLMLRNRAFLNRLHNLSGALVPHLTRRDPTPTFTKYVAEAASREETSF